MPRFFPYLPSKTVRIENGASGQIGVPVRPLSHQCLKKHRQRLIRLIRQILPDSKIHLAAFQQLLDLRAAVMGKDVDLFCQAPAPENFRAGRDAGVRHIHHPQIWMRRQCTFHRFR